MEPPQTSAPLIDALRSSAPYIHAHRGRTFVIALPGEAAAMESFAALIYDIALLHSLGVRIVLVHGARPQIDAALTNAGVDTQMVHGVRVTDAPALECVKHAVGSLRMEIEALLSTGLASTPMAGARLRVASGNMVIAKPLGIVHGVDHQHTGEVRRIDTAALNAHLERGHIVLLSPVGYSPTGEIFNLFAEDVATATASALAADKLIFLHPQQELHLRLADCPSQLKLDEVDALLAANPTLEPVEIARLTAATAACRAGVTRAHMVSLDNDGALLRELYSRDGAGTLISGDSYDTIRQADAEDAGGLLNLIAPLEASGVLVPRSREQLELEIGNFTVMLRDGLITACCALMPYTSDASGEAFGEVACVAVLPQYRAQGRAERLLAEVEARARKLQLTRLFVLTTKAPHWFVERGFEPASIDDLPVARRQMYNYKRNSMVLIKAL